MNEAKSILTWKTKKDNITPLSVGFSDRLRSGISEKKKVVIGLVIILALEIVLYSRSFSRFFCGDSLYFLSRRLTSLSDVINAFTKIDYLEVYRPLTFVLVTFTYPLFKLDPFGYHFVPLIFHVLNTSLVFLLMKKLLKTNLGACVAVFYFGIHSANFFVTYDLSALPDFTYALFYLLALLSFLRYLDTERKVWLASCVLAFVISLLWKEAAITLLAAVILAAIVHIQKRGDEEPIHRTLLQVTKKAWPLFTVGVVYFAALLAIKGWNLYPQRAGHTHYAKLTLKALGMKYKYLQWAFNLPDGLMLRRHALPKLVVTAGLAPFIGLFTLFAVRSIFVKNKVVWCGLLWFVATLSPVLVMPYYTMAHNLYVPIIGLALIFGSLAETALAYLRPRRLATAGAGMLLIFFVVVISACWVNIKSNLADSWLANGSVVAKSSLEDLKNAHPTLPTDATLYFLRSNEKDLPWFFDYGNLFRIFYNNPSIKVLFADRAAKLPPDYLDNDKAIVLRFVRPHLYDVTEEFKADMRDNTSLKLMQLVSERNVFFNEKEDYPRFDIFQTPTGKPVFVIPLARANTCREALVTIAGARIRFDVPPIENHSRLVFGVAMVYDAGDGAEGRIYFEHDGRKDLLYSRSLNPAEKKSDRRWIDEIIDLSKYAGKKGFLLFECNSGPRGDTMADWFAWSGMKIVRSYDGHVDTASSDLPQPTWIHFNPAVTRLGEYVIVTVGNGSHMTIDCKYKLGGVEKTKEKWLTTNAAGQFVFQPTEAGNWEITAIKNSLHRDWVPATAALIVE